MDRSAILDLLFSKSNPTIHYYLEQVVDTLLAAGVTIKIQDTTQVFLDGETLGCSGYFNNEPLEFAVAVGKPYESWLRIFLHEFSHFEQWQEDPEMFTRRSSDVDILFSWLSGDLEVSEEHLKMCRDNAIWIEHDCERRTIQKLHQYGFYTIIDVSSYTQMANAYFNFYHYVVENKVWYKAGMEPYTIPEVWSSFPVELTQLTELTDKHRSLYALCV